jgi:hypothetical protein
MTSLVKVRDRVVTGVGGIILCLIMLESATEVVFVTARVFIIRGIFCL